MEAAKSGLNASLLVKHPETGDLFVNFDPQIMELIQEAKYLQAMHLEVPEITKDLVVKENMIRDNQVA